MNNRRREINLCWCKWDFTKDKTLMVKRGGDRRADILKLVDDAEVGMYLANGWEVDDW